MVSRKYFTEQFNLKHRSIDLPIFAVNIDRKFTLQIFWTLEINFLKVNILKFQYTLVFFFYFYVHATFLIGFVKVKILYLFFVLFALLPQMFPIS